MKYVLDKMRKDNMAVAKPVLDAKKVTVAVKAAIKRQEREARKGVGTVTVGDGEEGESEDEGDNAGTNRQLAQYVLGHVLQAKGPALGFDEVDDTTT